MPGRKPQLSRRKVLAGAGCAAVRPFGAAPDRSARPNILWLIGEDLCPDLGCYGAAQVHTPNLDRLAAEGVRFQNAFATGPICSPSRSAMATGVYQTRIDAGNQHSHRRDGYRPPAPVRLFTHLLREAGYYSANVRDAAPGVRGSVKTDVNFHAEHFFDSDDWNRRKPGQPSYAQVNLREAHRPYVRSERPVDPSSVRLPAYLPDHPAVREDWAMYLESIQVLDSRIGAVLQHLEKQNRQDGTIVVFLGDNGREMPRDKTFVYDGGAHVPLIVRFPVKFLPRGSKPGMVRSDPVSLIDVTAATLDWAGIEIPSWMDGRPLFGPRASPRDCVYIAEDRCGWARDRVRSVRTAHFQYIRNFHPERPYLQHDPYMDVANISQTVVRQLARQGRLRGAQRALIEIPRPAEELYDLQSDPDEVRNLAGDPRYGKELRTLRGKLGQWLRETGDDGSRVEVEEPDTRALIDEWANTSAARLSKTGGVLRLECSGEKSLIRHGIVHPGGGFRLEFSLRSASVAAGRVIWGSIAESAIRKQGGEFGWQADGRWHAAGMRFEAPGHLAWIGFDFGAASGTVEFQSIRLVRANPGASQEVVREWAFGA